jgi:hypothetical protein
MSIGGEFDGAEDGVDSIEGGATVEAEDVGHFGEATNLEEIVVGTKIETEGKESWEEENDNGRISRNDLY